MNEIIRETFHSVEYDEYYAGLDEKTKTKYDYVELIIRTQYVVNKNFVIMNKYIGGQEDDED